MGNNIGFLDILMAINNCQFVEFKNTVENGIIDVNEEYDENGTTALKMVVSSSELDHKNKIKWIKLLVSLGADLNAKQQGVSPMFIAIQKEDTDMIKCLAEMGADIHESNNQGSTLICKAAAFGEIESIKCLVSLGADVNARDNYGMTPMFSAAASNQIESIQCLAELGADVNARDNIGCTPIYTAVIGNKAETLKCLTILGADINAIRNDGMTPLSFGISLGDAPEAVEWLKSDEYNKLAAECVKRKKAN